LHLSCDVGNTNAKETDMQKTIEALKNFIETNSTGWAVKAARGLVETGLDTGRVLPVQEWTPAYAAGLLAGVVSLVG
jgi:hypothetical protein